MREDVWSMYWPRHAGQMSVKTICFSEATVTRWEMGRGIAVRVSMDRWRPSKRINRFARYSELAPQRHSWRWITYTMRIAWYQGARGEWKLPRGKVLGDVGRGGGDCFFGDFFFWDCSFPEEIKRSPKSFSASSRVMGMAESPKRRGGVYRLVRVCTSTREGDCALKRASCQAFGE